MGEGKAAFVCPVTLGLTCCGFTSTVRIRHACPPPLSVGNSLSHARTPHFYIEASHDIPPLDVDLDEEPVLEGDVVAYRERASPSWRIGAVVEMSEAEKYSIRPLCSRSPEEDGSLECFVNWEAESGELSIQSEAYEIAIVDADYEERVVQDRLANPHGEVSEDCWRISTQVLKSFNVHIPRV